MVSSTKPKPKPKLKSKPSSWQTPGKLPPTSHFAKKPAKPNTSILSFFHKTEKPEESLFVGATITANAANGVDDDIYDADDNKRFNEHESPIKRRRVSQDESVSETTIPEEGAKLNRPMPSASDNGTANPSTETGDCAASSAKGFKPRIKTPFVMDSESEDEDDKGDEHVEKEETPQRISGTQSVKGETMGSTLRTQPPWVTFSPEKSPPKGPALLKQEDSIYEQFGNVQDPEDMDDFDPDTFEGEEMRVMRFMREQARLEAEEAEGFSSEDLADDPMDDGSTIQLCPICDSSLAGISTDDVTKHVNACLDGNPTPLPSTSLSKRERPAPVTLPDDTTKEVGVEEVSKRFARAAVPRPGQANPFELGGEVGNPAPKSAFSKLMSNNAEDSAWATAAATEHASRGRPAYERTCPFYKIMPGFSICVDAFRYGAVEGCKAYFLSHFHSDHYVGLTANWRHGPIYCSRVTGSLVKQQLRTAAKWVVELEFEKPYDIPGTEATVTMIPANHCPGSSLFLFQKNEGKGPSGRVKRILHCGDFRACPAHVRHPVLKPTVSDEASGKLRLQKIDICYLDTTYLNPRYSFPPQNDVIKASADLCANMSPDPDCKDDIWDKSAKTLGTPAVSKYFSAVKSEDDAFSEKRTTRPQQRLLVICGTYSIGKERICVAIAKALRSKIFASPGKIKICKQLGDAELSSLLTSNPLEAQVHMQMLMELRSETLQEYLNGYKPHFSRIVGFRPSGWNFRPAGGKTVGANTPPSSVPIQQILHGKGWRTRFGYRDFVAQRGSTKEAMCFGVPYSEHSSFRELAMFLMSLNIDRVIPTVNVGSDQSRQRMKGWIDRWTAERRKGGMVRPLVEGEDDEEEGNAGLWEGKAGKGGGAWW